MARYSDHGAHYDQTVLVKRGTPSGLFTTGLFQDKINLTTDQTDGDHSGNVYVAWSQYTGFAGKNNAVLFSRSDDQGTRSRGRSRSRPSSMERHRSPTWRSDPMERCTSPT